MTSLPFDDPTQAVLLYFVLPLWLIAGIADWLCHQATDIEHTSGAKESLLHLLLFAEVALPLLMCLFLEINALTFALIILAFLAHEATSLWDLSYSASRRYISPIEQHVHSFLEVVPLMAGAFVAVLHWPQFIALFGFGNETASYALKWKETPLPVIYILPLLAAALMLELLPYLVELWRGLRANDWRLVPPSQAGKDPRTDAAPVRR
ncbi:MAG: diguanylate cyclase [Xanthobacteraceae bacterium]